LEIPIEEAGESVVNTESFADLFEATTFFGGRPAVERKSEPRYLVCYNFPIQDGGFEARKLSPES
jgi:hypothetical protein